MWLRKRYPERGAQLGTNDNVLDVTAPGKGEEAAGEAAEKVRG